MKKIDQYINLLTKENKYSFYLSFFRVFIALLLLKKIVFQWSFIPLIYGGEGYLVPSNTKVTEFFITFNLELIRSNISLFIGIYIFLLLLFLFGFGKNLTGLALFLFYDILQKLCPQVLNGGDNYIRFILLYYVFSDSFEYFSINKGYRQRYSRIKNFLSNLAGLSICIHLCLIYFISAINKIHSDVWFNGVATYYTMNIDRFRGTEFNRLLSQNSLFVTITTYGTWLLELCYPFLVWFRQTKIVVIILMIFLHLGIGIFMMLYDFQLAFIMAQGFFFTNNFWLKKYLILYEQVKKHVFKNFNLSQL
jgi:hypothetical protein